MADLESLAGDRDLRRRLMAKVGKPLTASATSGGEPVAAQALDSIVSSVYEAASEDAAEAVDDESAGGDER